MAGDLQTNEIQSQPTVIYNYQSENQPITPKDLLAPLGNFRPAYSIAFP
jgi:hypothetical protein